MQLRIEADTRHHEKCCICQLLKGGSPCRWQMTSRSRDWRWVSHKIRLPFEQYLLLNGKFGSLESTKFRTSITFVLSRFCCSSLAGIPLNCAAQDLPATSLSLLNPDGRNLQWWKISVAL